MGVKVKKYLENSRRVKKNDKSKEYILRGERNVRYYEKNLSNKEKSYKFF